VRRRELLTGASALAGFLAMPAPATAEPGAPAGLNSMLITPTPAHAAPASLASLNAAVGAAWSDFRAVRYRQLAARLPALIHTATATVDHAPHDARAMTSTMLTEAYIVGTRLAIKLHEQGQARTLADRAVAAAGASADPATLARAQRSAAVVLRRSAHRDQARNLLATAADRLRADTGLRRPADASLYASMLATAAYTAALAGRRDEAWTFADEAKAVVAVGGNGFGLNDLTLYRAGIARALGDYGQAVDLMYQVRLDLFRTPERRARYWEDAALAWMGRGRPALAYQALREAELAAPQEVRYRPWAHQLTSSLLAADVRRELPDLRAFAARIGPPAVAM
jgi:hypothetical protein